MRLESAMGIISVFCVVDKQPLMKQNEKTVNDEKPPTIQKILLLLDAKNQMQCFCL